MPARALGILRERGLMRGRVLLLTDGPTRVYGRTDVEEFEVSGGAVGESTLGSRGDFDAVVLLIECLGWGELESHLARLAVRLAPGTLVTLIMGAHAVPPDAQPGHCADHRQELHLLLLRSGYHRVWVHAHRGTLCVSAARAPASSARMCSILVPVYNERATFPELMRQLLNKPLDHLGLEREIIIIESNSTDGTRELVAGFAGLPGVKVLWQDEPRGKGYAVRAGLQAASGDIVLIQDADLEYDLDDYEALLEPLLSERVAFVLGSRHSGRARMRKFTGQRLMGVALDAAHVLLTAMLNVLYRQEMKDPFTMFKVMRRDCLYGLEFECDRFDFDHELLIKLLKKGYRPLEIPVSYCSRSFKQGKKIRLLRDPPGWIFADLKYRLQRLRPNFK